MSSTDSKPWDTCDAETVEITDEQYFAAYGEYMSAHKLEDFRASPRHFHWQHKQALIPRRESPAFVPGGAFHCYTLEGLEAFNDRYIVSNGPINPKTGAPYGRDTKKFAAWLEEVESNGKTPITTHEYDTIQYMELAVRDHSMARKLLEVGQSEVTIRSHLDGIPFQSRLDWIAELNGRPLIVDLKTTADLGRMHTPENPCRFARDVFRFGYHRQMAVYQMMLERTQGADKVTPKVVIIAIEKAAPWPVGVFHLSDATMRAARYEVLESITELKRCIDRDEWPTRFESTISL